MSTPSSCLSRFVTDPWSSLKVVIPSVAIEVILHKKVWEKTSLRHLTLYLTMLNVYWFSSSLNFSFFETPLLCQVPSLEQRQKGDLARHRLGLMNKLELVVGVVSLDLFCEWRKRIVDHDGFVDLLLSSAVVAPALITAVQGGYFLPKLKDGCLGERRLEGTVPSGNKCCTDKKCCRCCGLYAGMEAVKVAGLAVAGLRFGKMLTV